MNQTTNTQNTSTANTAFDEESFALNVKHALNESAQALPQATLDKLYAVRRKAVSARNAAANNSNPVQTATRWLQGLGASLAAPLAFATPVLVVGVGLYIMSTGNADNYVQTVAEIDSQVLTQDLPINALLDKGFVRYVQVGE